MHMIVGPARMGEMVPLADNVSYVEPFDKGKRLQIVKLRWLMTC